jgi:hypothetical protein
MVGEGRHAPGHRLRSDVHLVHERPIVDEVQLGIVRLAEPHSRARNRVQDGIEIGGG